MALRCVAHGRLRAFVSVLGVALLLSALASPAEAKRRQAKPTARAPAYSPAYAAMVVDANSGRMLYGVNENEARYPASITKVMTLYLLFEQLERGRYRLDSPLMVSAFAQGQAPSKLGLRAGQTIEVEDAIKALVTKSANDVAVTVAENIGGSEDAFAEMMTQKARQLGMTRTVFRNASGLPDLRQVTTARDLVVLGRAIQERFPRYYAYFGTYSFAYRGALYRNHNKLLGQVTGVDGIKTGYTRLSGFNLLTSAKRGDGRHLIAVVLGGRSGAARDRQMATLVSGYMGNAYAGARTILPTTEMADAEPPAAAPVRPVAQQRPQPEAPATTATISAPLSRPQQSLALARVEPPRPALARPVVASAAGTATTTPSSSMRWQIGAAPAAPTKVKAGVRAQG
jgi:D-alanyl-D-alanine carboxypeptidase